MCVRMRRLREVVPSDCMVPVPPDIAHTLMLPPARFININNHAPRAARIWPGLATCAACNAACECRAC